MKASLFSALIILVAGGLLGWKQHGQLVTVRETHRQVIEEARALGLSPDALFEAGKPPLPTKSGREDAADKIAEAKSFARELIGFARKMKEVEKSGEPPDEALQKEMMETLRRFLDLSPTQIKTVIAEFKDSTEVDDEMRRGIVSFSIMMLANDQPETAISLATESAGIKGMEDMIGHTVSTSLGKWAEKDPLAAMEWLRKNSGKHGKLITDDTKAAILAGAAKQDPKLALGLVDDLGLKEPHRVANSLAQAARSPEERNALLATLRAEKKEGDLAKTTLNSLGSQLTSEGFESSQAWLSTAKLDEKETEAIADGLSAWHAGPDTGKWLEWMNGKVSEDTLKRKTDDLVREWTRRDFNAAGAWIGTLSDGTTKTAAVKSFAKTVAPYEPESAEQWANSLPAGKERDELLEQIRKDKKPAAPQGEDVIWTDPDDE